MEIIEKYFSNLTELQISQFSKLEELYKDWNIQINVVSRKDIDELYLRHVLHSFGNSKSDSVQGWNQNYGCRNWWRFSWNSIGLFYFLNLIFT